MNSKVRCDSCQLNAIATYTLSDFPDKPSFLCEDHGARYVKDAVDNGMTAYTVFFEPQPQPRKEVTAY